MSSQRIEVLTSDGMRLSAHLYGTSGEPILLSVRLGIPQIYYARFATWLSQKGYQVMTFDPRGMHESRTTSEPQSIRNVQADFLMWARLNFGACVEWLVKHADREQVKLIGHSLGMQHLLWADEKTQTRIKGCIAITPGTGFWKDWASTYRRMAPLLFYLLIPILTRVFGYFPGAASDRGTLVSTDSIPTRRL